MAIVFSKQCDWLCNIYIIFRLEIVLAVIVYHYSFIVVNVLRSLDYLAMRMYVAKH